MRRFSRFYTKRIALLDEAVLGSPYSLGEVRCLYEVAHGPASRGKAPGAFLTVSR